VIRLFEQRPGRFLRYLLLGQLVLWTLVPAFTYASAPLDVVENIAWGREWELGYYKHPPLQAWLSYGAWLGGAGRVWPVYLLSQIAIVLTQLGLFALAKDVAGEKRALWAVLLFSLVYYANLPSPEFNANILQMPIWVWAAVALRRAIVGRSAAWWLVLAVLLALGLYAKYSVIVLVGALGLALLTLRAGRASLKTPWPWVAGAFCLVLCAPQLWWLRGVDYLPLTFTAELNESPSVMQRLGGIASFLATQLLDQILAVILLLIAGASLASSAEAKDEAFDERRFVAVLAVAPLVLTILSSLASGIGVRTMWGAPMAAFLTLAAVVFLEFKPERLKWALSAWMVLFLALPLGTGVAVTLSAERAKPPKIALPGPRLARTLTDIWNDQTATPLDLVAGDTWPSGVVAAYSDDRPSVFVDGNWRYNPWVTRERVAERGVMVVWTGSDEPPPALAALGPFQARGQVQSRYRRGARLAAFKWAIRAPGLAEPSAP
jgi:4-amino-4-deoxy-L-arabinose transferase-like glycosyltransferase